MQKFQSTLPRGERLPTQLHRTQHDRFQSTLPRGERPSRLLVTAIEQNFNPRSREGSDPRYVDVIVDRWISIHAPARGATRRAESGRHVRNFNPRSREGSDSDGELVDLLKEISIHAPARGATIYTGGLAKVTLFQSTLPRGERHHKKFQILLFLYFNPRSREGSDYKGLRHQQRTCCISIHAPARGATIV